MMVMTVMSQGSLVPVVTVAVLAAAVAVALVVAVPVAFAAAKAIEAVGHQGREPKVEVGVRAEARVPRGAGAREAVAVTRSRSQLCLLPVVPDTNIGVVNISARSPTVFCTSV